MARIRLEILREGPANNQLLSPLTRYLALVNEQPAESLRLAVEQEDWDRWGRGFRYEDWVRVGAGPDPHRLVPPPLGSDGLLGARREVTRIFSSLACLAPAIQSANGTKGQAVHLRLVLSASELALLPFELVDAPPGFPGPGLPLLLQADPRFTLTRTTRRAKVKCDWNRRPRILMVVGADIPVHLVTAHLRALRAALSPWVGFDLRHPDRELRAHLTLLTRPTLDELAKACAATPGYTHIHFLAHGAAAQTAPAGTSTPVRYGIVLTPPGPDGVADPVDAARLDIAIRGSDGGSKPPHILTLATCDSANQGSIVTRGGSLAHGLHERGYPFVVASQFPLTFFGSIGFCRSFFREVLLGQNPRDALASARREMHRDDAQSHDWASLVAYDAVDEADAVFEARVVRLRGMRLSPMIVELREHVRRDETSSPAFLDEIDARAAELERDAAKRGVAGARAKRDFASSCLRLADILFGVDLDPKPVWETFRRVPAAKPVGSTAATRTGRGGLLAKALRFYERLENDQAGARWAWASTLWLRWAVALENDRVRAAGETNKAETLRKGLLQQARDLERVGAKLLNPTARVELATLVAVLDRETNPPDWASDPLVAHVLRKTTPFERFGLSRTVRREIAWIGDEEATRAGLWGLLQVFTDAGVPAEWPELVV